MSTTGKYIVASLCALALAVTGLSLGACRTTHLGPQHGNAYENALQAQREAEQGPTLTAQDAKQVLSVHALGKRATQSGDSGDASNGSISAPSIGGGTTSGGGSTSGGAWGGASGNISLDAK